jgi:uncharacterized protein YaiE (UPF0345 family)
MLKVNEYYGGQVKSIAFKTPEGPATVGVMTKGEYEFGTSTKEILTILSGNVTVKLPGSGVWKDFKASETFVVETGQKFQLKISDDVAYLCLYR